MENGGESVREPGVAEAEGAATPPPAAGPGDSASTSAAAADKYRVRLELFEGPLDLLLHLIKKNEVEIMDIPIATITEQYLSYIDLLQDLDLDIAGEYLVMAATLTLVKSRTLLPSLDEPGEEDEADPRADLVRQLLEYQRYREAAQAFGERPWLRRDVFARQPGTLGVDVEADDGAPPVRVSVWDLMKAFRTVLDRAKPDPVHQVASEAVSLAERVRDLLGTLSVARSLQFDSLFDDDSTKGYVIVTLLAVLELMKMGGIEAIQEEAFGPIMIVLAMDDVSSIMIDMIDDYGSEVVADG